MLDRQQLTDLVMSSFEAERVSDSKKGLSLIHDDFAVTEMNIGYDGQLFRRVTGDAIRNSIQEVFRITDREYQFVHAMADEKQQTVIVEFVESYGDPKTGKRYRTPIVAICEVKDGKIWRTRHYTDDRLSDQFLTQEQIDEALS